LAWFQKVADAAPKAAEDNKGVAFLVGSVAAVAAILTALGITGGVIGRMARNHDVLTFLAISLAAFASVVGVIAWLQSKSSQRQKHLLWLGLAIFLAAAGFAIAAAIRTWNDSFAPRVTASVEETARGEVIVLNSDAAGLKADQRLTTAVWPLASVSGPTYSGNGGIIEDRFDYTVEGLPIYRTANGPNADGEVSLASRVPVPADHPARVIVRAAIEDSSGALSQPDNPDDCFEDTSAAGCITLDLGEPTAPPLDVGWSTVDGRRILDIKIGADQSAGRRLFVRVFGRSARGSVVLARAELPLSQGEATTRDVQVFVPGDVRSVCAVASPVDLSTGCPPQPRADRASRHTCVAARLETVPRNHPKPSHADLRMECRSNQRSFVEGATSWMRMRIPD
jgi:hypothetical protein